MFDSHIIFDKNQKSKHIEQIYIRQKTFVNTKNSGKNSFSYSQVTSGQKFR